MTHSWRVIGWTERCCDWWRVWLVMSGYRYLFSLLIPYLPLSSIFLSGTFSYHPFSSDPTLRQLGFLFLSGHNVYHILFSNTTKFVWQCYEYAEVSDWVCNLNTVKFWAVRKSSWVRECSMNLKISLLLVLHWGISCLLTSAVAYAWVSD